MKNNDDDAKKPLETQEEDLQFEISPEEATSLGKDARPGLLNRKRILIAICVSFSVIIGGGLIFSNLKSSKKKAADQELSAGSSSNDNEFLTSLQNRALYNRRESDEKTPPKTDEAKTGQPPEPLLPPASLNAPQYAPQPRAAPPPPSAPAGRQQAPDAPQQEPTHFKSSLVPPIQGRLFSQAQPQAAQPSGGQANDYFPNALNALNAQRSAAPAGQASDYASQNNQENKQAFYDSSSGGAIFNGMYLGGNSIWTGTVIPAALETSISTDLPGNVLARVTQNVYDSLTGKTLLIPQGTLLVAKYNSSVSYAQNRVQIVWDVLIRPDGYQLELEGANGVDQAGMSGQAAKTNEHWFEYLKAAGLITLFSIANSSLAEKAAEFASQDRESVIAQQNSQMLGQLGGSIIGRAMNIQPTLTVQNGSRVNVMLNKTLYLPPLDAYRASQKYILE